MMDFNFQPQFNHIMEKRRDFIKKVAVASAGVMAGNSLFGMSAKSYRNIIGANERIHVAIIGLNGRGTSMASTFARQKNAEILTLCDVDTRVFAKALKAVADNRQVNVPKTEGDCRKVMQDKNIDAIYIATPDHWHTPLTIMGCQSGKHVYVEKPLSHNPHEGELAIIAARKYNRVVQMGAQRRSAVDTWRACDSKKGHFLCLLSLDVTQNNHKKQLHQAHRWPRSRIRRVGGRCSVGRVRRFVAVGLRSLQSCHHTDS